MDIDEPYTQQHHSLHSSHSHRSQPIPNLQVLCRISFHLDQISEELLVKQNSSLKGLVEQLINKLKDASLIEQQDALMMAPQEKDILKAQIRARIQQKMDQNTQKSLQAATWRNRLKDIIDEKIRTPMDSLVSPSTQRHEAPTKSVPYFKSNQGESNRQKEMMERMRALQKEMKGQQRREQKRERLYELGRQAEQIKEYLYKAHQHQALSSELAECTFHPNIRKINTQSTSHPPTQVFERLYKEAAEKKEKVRRLTSQIQHRRIEQEKSLNFIPKINECSKQIVLAKQEQKLNIYEVLYQQAKPLNNLNPKFHPQYTFHPALSAKSSKIANQRSAKRLNTQQYNQQLLKKASQASLKVLAPSKSPIKNKKAKVLRAKESSQIGLQKFKQEQQTIKRGSCESVESGGQQTLKGDIFCKKAFKKNKPSKSLHCFVEPHNIRREKITILDTTNATCNTEESLPPNPKPPLFRPNAFSQSNISNPRSKDQHMKESGNSLMSLGEGGGGKGKRRGLDPFSFFKDKEEQNISNKENIKQLKQQQEGKEQEFKRRKNRVFQDIFTYLLLQAKLESQITYQAIVASPSIPQYLKHVFYPMAEEMQELGVGLDKQQFTWSMLRIFDSLSLQQRGWILGWGLKLQGPQRCTGKLR